MIHLIGLLLHSKITDNVLQKLLILCEQIRRRVVAAEGWVLVILMHIVRLIASGIMVQRWG